LQTGEVIFLVANRPMIRNHNRADIRAGDHAGSPKKEAGFDQLGHKALNPAGSPRRFSKFESPGFVRDLECFGGNWI
jgi:hypothetical protein